MSRAPTTPPKPLAKCTLADIKAKNKAREQVGLPPLRVKVRSCLVCGRQFETVERYTCGCSLRLAAQKGWAV